MKRAQIKQMNTKELTEIFSTINEQLGKNHLLDNKISAIVKDLKPNIQPSYIVIIKKLVDLKIINLIYDLSLTKENNEFEILKIRSNFKENNSFDEKAFQVFDALCNVFGLQTEHFLSTNQNPKTDSSKPQNNSSNDVIPTIKTKSLNGKMTSYDIHMVCDSRSSTIDFLNQHHFKKTNTWRLPTSSELKNIYLDLQNNNNNFDNLWCIDSNSKSLSVFDIQNGTHEKCRSKQQLEQLLPLFAVSDISYSPILDKELAIHLKNNDEWGVNLVYGSLGEHHYPEGFINALNSYKLYNKTIWKLPTILELEQLYKHRTHLGLKPNLPVWSSTEPKKFFVNVLDFETGEIKEWKKWANTFDERKGSVIIVANN